MGKRLQTLTGNYFVIFDLVPGLVSANCFSLADKWHFDATINISQGRFRLLCDGKQISRLLIIISCEPWLCNSFPNSSYLNALHSIDCLWFHSIRFYRPRTRGCRHDISPSCNPWVFPAPLPAGGGWGSALQGLRLMPANSSHNIRGPHTLPITYDVISAGVYFRHRRRPERGGQRRQEQSTQEMAASRAQGYIIHQRKGIFLCLEIAADKIRFTFIFISFLRTLLLVL